MDTQWIETILAALMASFKFALTVPFYVISQEFTFTESLIFGVSSGTFGIIVFMFLSTGILKFWNWFKLKTGLFKRRKPRKVFTKKNRRFVRLKSRFGLAGIAILSPLVISIPIGCFIAMRYYKNKKKIFLYFFLSVVFWSLIFATFGTAMIDVFDRIYGVQ